MRFQNILNSVMAHLIASPFVIPGFMSTGPNRHDRKRDRVTTLHPRNGKREVARRLRQIAAGQLTRSNGLVSRDELYGRRAA